MVAQKKGLKARAAQGVRWNAVSAGSVAVLRLLRVALLARVLPADAFGLMALVSLVITLAQTLGAFGFSQGLIQRQQVTPEERSSVYWLSIAVAILIFLVVLGVAPVAAYLFSAPQLTALTQVTAISLLIGAAGGQFGALAQKELRFKFLAVVDILSACGGLVAAVLAAWIWDQGVWSLVWAALAGGVARLIALGLDGWKRGLLPDLHFRLHDTLPFVRFGAFMVGRSILSTLRQRFDQALIGGLLGTEALGFYRLAMAITVQPVNHLTGAVSRVAFPVLARVQADRERMQRGYVSLLHALAIVSAPVAFGIAATADVFVPAFLGQGWGEVVPLAQVLAIFGFFLVLGGPAGALLLATGRSDATFYWMLLSSPIVIAIVYTAASLGNVLTVAWALTVSQPIFILARYWLQVRRVTGPCGASSLRSLVPATVCSLVMLWIVLSAQPLVAALPNPAPLVAMSAIGAAIYVTGMLLIDRRRSLSMLALLLGRRT